MKRMSPARAIAYGLPGLATLFTFTMFTTYGLYFFTNVVGLSGKFAGLIMTIGTLWDAVTDPLVGIISDNRDPRKGRRRPFLLVCAIPFGIVTWLLFTAWDFVEIQQKIYFIIVALLFYTFQTLIDVPYTSLSGEVTDNYDLRSKLANKTLKDITLGDVIRLMESTTKINRCLEDDAYCSRKAVDFCAVRRYYAKVQEKLETQFFSISLKEILEQEGA